MFTYTLGGHALMLGRQQVSDDGGFVWLNQGNVRNDNNRPEGAGGSSFYLFTDSMINQFARAGENTNFGQYSYDFAALGVPGLKASVAYLRGDDVATRTATAPTTSGNVTLVDYTISKVPSKAWASACAGRVPWWQRKQRRPGSDSLHRQLHLRLPVSRSGKQEASPSARLFCACDFVCFGYK
jgi:hypothetical protein